MVALSEKPLLPAQSPESEPTQSKPKTSNTKRNILTFVSLFLLIRFLSIPALSWNSKPDLDAKRGACAQADALFPQTYDPSHLINGNEGKIIDWLSGAIRVPTEIFDVMGEIGEDPRWDVFYKFADYLEEAFPLVHKHLTRTRVVTHALVFEWQGSDPSLQPILITGHQDVVPVLNATRGAWTHDPYGGEYDKETDLIWGRGASDDKSGVIGALGAIELLLESDLFRPTRTVVLSFGIDEETGGKVGAFHLNEWIEAKYGKDSFAILVDEGSGTQELWGQLYATPAVGEKGYLDVEVRVETLGGHSSVPPVHTGIGLTALAIAALERNPHKPYLNPESPLVQSMICAAEYSPEIPSHLRRAINKVGDSLSAKGKGKVDVKALKEVEDWWVHGSAEDGTLGEGLGRAMVSTTQAADIINGGVKVNALPEVVTAVVNHRISVASSVNELQEHLVETLSPVAYKYNLSLEAFGTDIVIKGCPAHLTQAKAGKLILAEAYNSSLNPAPVSPHTVDSAAWRLLSGTTKAVYKTRRNALTSDFEASKDIQFSPTISTGNTDTKRYWALTRNIYRFAYQDYSGAKASVGTFGNVHTVNEHIPGYTFIEQVRWFLNFIVNADESRDL